MARLFDDGSSQYLQSSAAPVTAAPFTMAGWFRPDESAVDILFSIGDKDTAAEQYLIFFQGATEKLCLWREINNDYTWGTDSTAPIGSWVHAAAVITATDDVALFTNGADKQTDLTDCPITAWDNVVIGSTADNGKDSLFTGGAAEIGIWNVALSDAEVAILAAGFSPLFVRPQNLVAYWSLIRDEDQDRVGGYDLTAYGSPTIAAHPPVIYPPTVQPTRGEEVDGFIQQYFRVRLGDTELLNDNTGWAADQNTNATIGTGINFRIRLKVREIGSSEGSTQFKLQVNRNSAGWDDVPEWRGATHPAAVLTLSGQFADGDITSTELLTSTVTYVDGEAVSDDFTPAWTSAYTLGNEETEFEFAIRIMTTHDGPTHTVAGDELEFRLVESDGKLFPNTYTNPTITVTETDGMLGGCTIETPTQYGPFCDTNGNLYHVMEYAESENYMVVMKSTDGGVIWRPMDESNAPTEVDLEGTDIVQVGSTLHILQIKTDVLYHTFRTSDHASADTWDVIDEVVDDTLTGHDTQSGSLAVLSDARVRAFYIDADTPDLCWYNTRSAGGTWGGKISLDTEGTYNFVCPVCVLGESDLVYVFYKDDSQGIIYYRTLNSANTLSGRTVISTDIDVIGTDDNYPYAPPIYYDSSGVEKIMLCYQKTDSGVIYTRVISDGTLQDEYTASDYGVTTDEGGNHQVMCALAVDGTTVHLIYSRDSDRYMLRDDNEDEGGWGTDAVEQTVPDGLESSWMRSQVFTHSSGNGGAKVLGYIWDEGSLGGTGYLRYNELVLQEGAVEGLLPFLHRLKSVTGKVPIHQLQL